MHGRMIARSLEKRNGIKSAGKEIQIGSFGSSPPISLRRDRHGGASRQGNLSLYRAPSCLSAGRDPACPAWAGQGTLRSISGSMEEVVAFHGLGIATLCPTLMPNDFGLEFHSEKSPRNRSHFKGGERPGDHRNSFFSNGFEYRFEILLRMDQ